MVAIYGAHKKAGPNLAGREQASLSQPCPFNEAKPTLRAGAIVFVQTVDPVGAGYVARMAKHDGNDPIRAFFVFLDLLVRHPDRSPSLILLILRSVRHMRRRSPT